MIKVDKVDETYMSVRDLDSHLAVNMFKRKEEKEWKINWSGIGSVSVKETEAYIALLQKAIETTKN